MGRKDKQGKKDLATGSFSSPIAEASSSNPKAMAGVFSSPTAPSNPRTPTGSTRRLPLANSPLEGKDPCDDEQLFGHKIRSKLSKSELELAPLVAKSTTAKRNFSELSIASAEDLQQQRAKLLKPSDYQKILNDLLPQRSLKLLEASLAVKESVLNTREKLVTVLNEKWQSGSLDVPASVYQSERERLEKQISILLTDIAVLRTSKHQIQGQMVDEALFSMREAVSDWSYIDLLISRYKTPPKATLSLFTPRDVNAQERFRKDVFKAYGAQSKGLAWCPISAAWHCPEFVSAAHVVRYNIGEMSARHLFGEADDKNGHLMSPRNGMPMLRHFERLFDEASIVITPTEDGKSLKVFCLDDVDDDDEIAQLCKAPSGKALHGRTLEFQNDFRPSMRSLYVSFRISILRRQRHEVPGWWKDRVSLAPQKVWASPGEYLVNRKYKVL